MYVLVENVEEDTHLNSNIEIHKSLVSCVDNSCKSSFKF